MSQIIKLADGSIAPDIEKLYGDAGGDVGPDAAFRIGLVTGAGLTSTGDPVAHTITFAVSGGGLDWSTTGVSGALAVNTGTICTAGAALSFSLPATSAVGNMISLTLDGSTSWTITQGAGQQIRIGNQQTTAGVGGSLASTAQGDCVTMVCEIANLKWLVVSSMGNITVV